MLSALKEPGGVTGVCRFGMALSSMAANPPSTVFSFCAHAAVVNIADAKRKERLLLSGVLGVAFSECDLP